MPFDVLFVCTGNICRSPMAERLFLARVAAAAPVRAGSAGTSGLVGHAMDRPSAAVLQELGAEATGHVARRLTAAMAESAHLVLTAESDHRAAVLRMAPMAFRRTFTLREFARLGVAADRPSASPTASDLQARVSEIAGLRGFTVPAASGTDEIGDPFGASNDVVRRIGAEISAAVDAAIAALGLPER